MPAKIRATHRNKQFLTDAIGALDRLDQPGFSSLLTKTSDSSLYKLKGGMTDGVLDLLADIDAVAQGSTTLNADSAMIIAHSLASVPDLSANVKLTAMFMLAGLLDKEASFQLFGRGGPLEPIGPVPSEPTWQMNEVAPSAYARHLNDSEDLDVLFAKFSQARVNSSQWSFHALSGFKFTYDGYIDFLGRATADDVKILGHSTPSGIYESAHLPTLLEMGLIPSHPHWRIKAICYAFANDDVQSFETILKSIDNRQFLEPGGYDGLFQDFRNSFADMSQAQKTMGAMTNEIIETTLLAEVDGYFEKSDHKQNIIFSVLVSEGFQTGNTTAFDRLFEKLSDQDLIDLAETILKEFSYVSRSIHYYSVSSTGNVSAMPIDESRDLSESRLKMLGKLKIFADKSVEALNKLALDAAPKAAIASKAYEQRGRLPIEDEPSL
jgi:hypothetical protein